MIPYVWARFRSNSFGMAQRPWYPKKWHTAENDPAITFHVTFVFALLFELLQTMCNHVSEHLLRLYVRKSESIGVVFLPQLLLNEVWQALIFTAAPRRQSLEDFLLHIGFNLIHLFNDSFD